MIQNSATNRGTTGISNLLSSLSAANSRPSETRQVITSGMASWTPKTRNAAASSSVQSVDEEAEVNSNGVAPNTPCSARFLARAMWMYASSRAYTRWPSVRPRPIRATTAAIAANNAMAEAKGHIRSSRARRSVLGMPFTSLPPGDSSRAGLARGGNHSRGDLEQRPRWRQRAWHTIVRFDGPL